MNKSQSISKLKIQLSKINELKCSSGLSSEFTKWYRGTEIAIQKIFGEETRHYKDFTNISYITPFTTDPPSYDLYQKAYHDGLNFASAILQSFIDEIDEYWDDNSTTCQLISSPIKKIELICNRFDVVARQLLNRHDKRPTLKIEDEYDAQDLFHSLLKIYFDDIRDEEWTPSYAGSCSRVDFLLKPEKIVIELKKTNKNLQDKKIGEQLLIDIQKYKEHPSCSLLFCFVYDSEKSISNPKGLENDLSKNDDQLDVKVMIRPL